MCLGKGTVSNAAAEHELKRAKDILGSYHERF